MSRNKILLILIILLGMGLVVLQSLFNSRLNDPATLQFLQEQINEQRDPKDALRLRPGVWKTGWFMSARTDSLDLMQSGRQEAFLTLKQLRFDLDLLPSLFKGRIHVQWDAREKQSGSMLKGALELRLTDYLPHAFQLQSGPLPLETLLLLFPDRVRSSQWLHGLQGRLRLDGRGSWEQSQFDVEVSELRWRAPGIRLPLMNGGRSRTQIAYAAGQWSFNPPLALKDQQTGVELKLDYEQTLRLTLSGPPLVVAALAQSQRCPVSARLELRWTSQGFVCR